MMQSLVRRAADMLGRDSAVVRTLRPLYREVLSRVYRDRGMPWEINGVPLRIDPALREHLPKVFDPSVAAWLRPRIRPGQVAWNVGANVGAYTLQLASWVGPSGHVVAVEPNPVARAALERHVAWNGMASRVTVIAAAVGEEEGEATLWTEGASSMGAVGQPNPHLAERARPVKVRITTLDAIVAGGAPRPDWIVMDVEGYELRALRGSEHLLAESGRGLGIVVELHPDVWTRNGESTTDLDALLRRHGRVVTPLRGDEAHATEQHSIVALEPAA